jgi:hypothetical protein
MNSRRFMCSPLSEDRTLPHRCKIGRRWQRWVKMRKSRNEHMSAGLPQIADIARRSWHGRKVPARDIDDANQIDQAQKTAPLNLAIQSPLGS